MAVFVPPGPAEILRAVQKDQILHDLIDKQLTNLVIKSLGTNVWLRYRQMINMSSKFLYHAFTTLSGFQTLGEEYTNIVQVDLTLRRAPSLSQRLLLAILDACGSIFIENSLDKLERKINKNDVLHENFKQRLTHLLIVLKAALPFLIHLHHAVFYWNGSYYNIVKRILGIRYVLARPWLSKDRKMYGFQILAVITLLHLSISLMHSLSTWYSTGHTLTDSDTSITTSKYAGTCSLCLELRTYSSLTPCGHLFCWFCILKWLQTSSQCPVCRDIVESSRIVPLQNYD